MTNPQKIRFDHRVSGFPLLFESAIRNPRCICVRKPWKSLRISKSPYASQNLENCFPKEALLFKLVHSMERHDAIKVNTLRSLLGQWVCRKMNLIGRVRGKKTTAVSLSHHVYVCHTCKHDRRSPTPNVSDLTKEAKSNMDKQSLMISDEKSVEGRKHQKKTEKNICFGKKNDNYNPSIWPQSPTCLIIHSATCFETEWRTFKHRCQKSASLWRFEGGEAAAKVAASQNGGSCGKYIPAFLTGFFRP